MRPSGGRPGPGARRPTRPSTTSTARTARPWRHVSSSAGRGRTQSADASSASGPTRASSGRRSGSGSGGGWAGATSVDDAVGVVDDAGVMGRDDDRRTLVTGRGQDARDGRPRQPVLPDRGLVGEHERGAVRDGGRHRQAPLLAAGELARVGVGEVGEPERGEQGVGAATGERRGRGRGRAGVVSTSSRTVRPTSAVAARCGTQATTRARSGEDHSCGGVSRSRASASARRPRPA